jgi:SAM-dependent methyltransferase
MFSMKNLFGNFTASSASSRLLELLRHYGLPQATAVCLSMVDDHHIRSFDRKYRVRTSGHIELSETSFDRSKLHKATSYGPVNAWGFRKLLRVLNLPQSYSFVDLGCGLGRACILAAEYGFARVRGVELAPELCQVARENLANCKVTNIRKSPIEIIEGDVLDYCDHSEDDVYFMYRAFSIDFFQHVLEKLVSRSASHNRPFTVIYTERIGWPQSECASMLAEHPAFRKIYRSAIFGQVFFVYGFRPEASPVVMKVRAAGGSSR